ncbi:MAG: hypothetical protein AAB263_17940 [Planctomycetota bacterium]
MKLIPFVFIVVVATASAAELTPTATVESWLTIARSNDLSVLFTKLTPDQQHAWSEDWKRPAANAANRGGQGGQNGQGRQGRGGGGSMFDRQIRQLNEADGAKTMAHTLVNVLIEAGNIVAPANTPALPSGTAGQDQNPWAAFMPRMLAGMLVTALPQRILADGLETRQIAAIQKLYDAHRTWAATVKVDDEQQVNAIAGHLAAVGKALKVDGDADLTSLEIGDVLTRLSTALPELKQACVALGLDADAVLASAKVTTESATGDDAVVVISFTAYGVAQAIPCKLRHQTDGWQVVADSPSLRWMRSQQGMMGGFGGGRPGGRPGGRQQRGGEGPPAPVPATKPGETAF